jgi:ABC-type antimicrobial peptide transport system permease subunit
VSPVRAAAAGAARGSIGGLLGDAAFALAYGWLARRLNWPASLLGGGAAFVVAALAITLVLGPTIDSLVLGGGGGFGGSGRGFVAFGGFGTGGGGLLGDPSLIVLAFGITLALGIVGSLYPVLRAMNLKPAEALRHVE